MAGSTSRRRWTGRAGRWIAGALLLLAAAAGGLLRWHGPRSAATVPGAERAASDERGAHAGSAACRACHAREFELWRGSHHALAERALAPALDRAAFDPSRTVAHGTQQSVVRSTGGRFELVAAGRDGQVRPHAVAGVLGVAPLRQFLVPGSGGRFQVTELAFDAGRGDWFDVYGDEDRRPGEWGHWTGRGMTWNSMCAACHNTGLRKNYQEAADAYATVRAETGIGCEACHGPAAAHAARTPRAGSAPAGTVGPSAARFPPDRVLDVCASCHSRRGELTGAFAPGDLFTDHYQPAIPDASDLFYPDGQVRDEDFEYAAFLGSRMFAAGVRCLDCHDPHSGKLRADGDALCLRCHGGPAPAGPRIDAATHARHRAGTAGGRCVDCHMPQTVYMRRHARRDHGFTIPDPVLTARHGIPNACSRCHSGRTADWAAQTIETWYGPRPARTRRARARAAAIAEGRAGRREAVEPLIGLARQEPSALWRASAVGLLAPWARDPSTLEAVLERARDPEPLVRAAAARALEAAGPDASAAARAGLGRLLGDASRLVRVAAAWGLRATVDPDSPAGRDLAASLAVERDQPTGQLRTGVYELARGNVENALPYLRRAAEWDPGSAPLREALAVALSTRGEREAAVRELEAACRLDPRVPEYRFKLGLALNEAGNVERACAAFEEAVKLDAGFGAAWYNLGLAYAAIGRSDRALEALARAEAAEPGSPRAPYARATVLARLGRVEDARAAARQALRADPGFGEARTLLGALEAPPR